MARFRRLPSPRLEIRCTEGTGTRSRRAWGGSRVLVLALALSAVGSCRASAPAAEAARAWAAGPARWLLLPEERRRLDGVRTPLDLESFLESFWAQRDPDPEAPGNPALAAFKARVADADLLYKEGSSRGSLTDRGGALVLLGPPHVLRYTQTEAPSLARGGGSAAHPTETLTVEVWIYLMQELPVGVQEALRERRGPSADVSLTFLAEGQRTRLLEGRELLGLAARATRRNDVE